MAFIFTITTPVGIAIGIGIQSTYNANSSNALIVQGIFDSVSTGERPGLDESCTALCMTRVTVCSDTAAHALHVTAAALGRQAAKKVQGAKQPSALL